MSARSAAARDALAPDTVSIEAARLAVALAWVAGGVDAIGYLTLSHLFTAHVSGNSVVAGAALGQAQWSTVLERGVPIALFLFGIAIATAVGEVRRAHGARHPFAALYAAEAALLSAFWLAGARGAPDGSIEPTSGWPFYAFAALPTLAMGVQNATLRRVGRHGVHTTYVSGVLTNLAEALVQLVYQPRGARAQPETPAAGGSPKERVRLYSSLWTGYLIGAVMGGFGQQRWGFAVLLLPIAGLGLVAVRDVLYPGELGLPNA